MVRYRGSAFLSMITPLKTCREGEEGERIVCVMHEQAISVVFIFSGFGG
jgi:hypothetical protein